MQTENFKGTIESAYGDKLPKALSFSGSFEAYQTLDEVPADKRPTDSEIVDFVNSKLKANARQAAMNKVLTENGITKPTLEDSPELQVKTMVKALVSSGKYDEAQATAIAKQTLGY